MPQLLDQQQRRLIIGGHDISPHRYPYYAAIDKNNGVIVSGALIAPDIVLSAGHVAMDNTANLTIKVGPYSVHHEEEFAETIGVDKWLIPGSWLEFQPTYFIDDYMILKLQHRSTHEPVKINWNKDFPTVGEHVIMMGLGWTDASHESPAKIVQEAELVYVSNEACEASSDPSRGLSYKGKIKESMMCTVAPPNTTRDGCAWDSGSPLIVPGKTPDEDVLVALGSTGVGCADPFFPGIQARIAADAGLLWIRQQVCRLSEDPPSDFKCSSLPSTSETNSETNSTASPGLVGAVNATDMQANVFASKALLDKFSFVGANASSSSAPFVLVGFAMAMAALAILGRRPSQRRQNKVDSGLYSDLPQPTLYGSIDC